MIYLQLFWEFFVTGLFSIGGGLATLPFFYKMAERYDWFSAQILPDMIAISESTPGPIGVNMATYAGFQAAGLLGGLVATLAIVLPAFLIIIAVSKPLKKYQDHQITQSIFFMLRPAVMGLVTYAFWQVVSITLVQLPATSIGSFFQWKSIIVFAVVWVLYEKLKAQPIFYIVGCALIGILFKL